MRRLVLILLTASLPRVASAQSFDLDLKLTEVASFGATIVHAAHPGDGSGRLFVVRKQGGIDIYQNGQVQSPPFLDITDDVSGGFEQGLLSVAFPPDFQSKQYFYVMYTDPQGTAVVSRFAVSGTDPDRADADSEQIIMRVLQPFNNHNGGQLAFGPDGMLYIGLGDGGSANDPNGNGQNPLTLLGTILRIDVEGGESPYGIPPDNPFVGNNNVLNEIFAYGLRNPWRFSFDRDTGDLFIADVGQALLEEINFVPAGSSGQNFGWVTMEGTVCQTQPCNPSNFDLPVFEYTHDFGCSVTGGHIYRGANYPNLSGIYLFADYCSGNIWALERRMGSWVGDIVLASEISITSFAEDAAGNVYALSNGGRLYLISDGPPAAGTIPITSGFTGAWFDPEQNGHGLFIEVLPGGRLLVWWFTFDDEGNQMWFGGVGDITGDTAEIEVYRTEGGRFIPNFDPDDITNTLWGVLTIVFFDCNHGRVDFASDLGFGSGSMALTRITLPAGLSCG